MGELSKKIGEQGEKLALQFIKKIGWAAPSDGETLQCNKSIKHQRKEGSPRTTHGIDLFFPYKSNLESFSVDNAIISVKYTSKPYPSPPTSIFKAHFKDLAEAVECFARSELRTQSNSEFEEYGIRKSNDIGVLFWFTSDRGSDQDIVSKINGVVIDKNLEFGNIQIVDNHRASFIYNSVATAEKLFPDGVVYFHYAFSSSNFSDPSIEKFGKILPIEYLTSPIIPMRVVNRDTKKQQFCISSIENYNEEAMKRLLNFASDISQDFSNEFVFFFTRYNKLEDGPSVIKCIRTLGEKASSVNVSVHSSEDDFRGMINE